MKLSGLALLCCAAALLPASASARTLSDERGKTRWAHVDHNAAIRAEPDAGSRRVGTVRHYTRYGEVDVLVLLERKDNWVRVRYSGLGERTGWVHRSVVPYPRLTRMWVELDTSRQLLVAHRGGRRVFSTRVGVGAPSSPTPAGTYFIRERLVFQRGRGIYGPLALGLSAYSPQRTDWPGGGQVGIHGTNQPGLIPGRISNGCVRLRNSAIRRLGRLVKPGTPVHVR